MFIAASSASEVTNPDPTLRSEYPNPAVLAGLDSLLDKDWRGQGFDQDVDQLIRFIQSDKSRRQEESSQVCVGSSAVHQWDWRSLVMTSTPALTS